MLSIKFFLLFCVNREDLSEIDSGDVHRRLCGIVSERLLRVLGCPLRTLRTGISGDLRVKGELANLGLPLLTRIYLANLGLPGYPGFTWLTWV